jgi:hypothetical protein
MSAQDPDAQALAELDRKLNLLNDRVTGVVRGYASGLFLYGAGGLGKSFHVVKQLEALECDFRPFNSRMSGKGLFRALEKSPDAVILVEDMERLTTDRDAQAVLLSALWSQGDRERIVTWVTGDVEKRFEFRGGLIMVANRPLSSLPELRALAGRISVMKLDISETELAAQMRRIARQGWARYQHRLDPEE